MLACANSKEKKRNFINRDFFFFFMLLAKKDMQEFMSVFEMLISIYVFGSNISYLGNRLKQGR